MNLAWAMSRPTTMVPFSSSGSRNRVLGELGQDLLHRLVQVDVDAVLMLASVFLRDQAARIAVQFFDEEAVPGDLRLDVAVGRAGDRHADRAGGAVPREADDPDVVGKVLAAELGADAQLVRLVEQLLLQFQIAERLAVLVPLGRKLVVILGGGELDRFHAGIGTGAADDDGDVIRRAGGGAEVLHLADQELQQAFRGEQRLGLLEEGGLVGGAAALGHEEELVGRRRPRPGCRSGPAGWCRC